MVTSPRDTNATKLSARFAIIMATDRERRQRIGRHIFKLLFARLTMEHMFHRIDGCNIRINFHSRYKGIKGEELELAFAITKRVYVLQRSIVAIIESCSPFRSVRSLEKERKREGEKK